MVIEGVGTLTTTTGAMVCKIYMRRTKIFLVGLLTTLRLGFILVL